MCPGAPGWRAMLLHWAPPSLLRVVLGSFVVGAFCGPPSHSLSYFYLYLPDPNQGQSQFFVRGYLDDQSIANYDSLTGKMENLVPWMEEKTKTFLALEWVFRDELEKLSQLSHLSGGLHTWQAILGCEFKEDRSIGGFLHYGYDGMDFIRFQKETLRWVAAQPQAQKVTEEWEEDPAWSKGNKGFLEETCIEWLQRYLSYQNKTLQWTEPPVGKVTHKAISDSVEVLICQAFGFYPKEIQATWTRDGEVCQYETLHRNMAPNSDGTYYVWLSIDIDPKERDRFRCHLEHEGLEEPLVLAWKEETGRCRRPQKASAAFCQEVRTYYDQIPLQSFHSYAKCNIKNEFQTPFLPLLSTKLALEASFGRQRSWSDPEITVSSLRRQEGKQHQMWKRTIMWLETYFQP